MKSGKAPVREKGQALILIVLAVAGLLGLTALAVDGSHVFAQRRQAQNAADTASFAAAIEKIHGDAPGNSWAEALARAASNDFADDTNDYTENAGQTVDVIVLNPPDSTAPAAYVGDSQYVQVKINANIGTFFARVVGVSTLPIHVQAVAKAKPATTAAIGGDNGIVALGDVCNAVRTHGGGHTTLTGGGVFSNSSANGSVGDCWSFNAKGTGDQITIPSAQVVGCAHGIDSRDITDGKIIFTGGGSESPCAAPIPYPPPPPDLGIDCASMAPGTRTGHTLSPGRWATGHQWPPAGVTDLDSGVYCVYDPFIIGSSDNLTGTNVTFIIMSSASVPVRWNAGATVNFTPSNAGTISGLLMYRPLNVPSTGLCTDGSNPACQTLEFNGGASSNWSGTIFAPDAECDVNGTSDSFSPHAQAICYVVDIGGSSTWSMTYDGSTNWDFPYPPETELNR
jgi:putative Flp pilus-assembly TadE/G-like protein